MSCENSLNALLAHIDSLEGEIGAWAWLDHEAALAQARALDAGATRGALHGMAVGIKDVIATADMPTEYNSPIYAGHRPAADAEVVRRLRSAGAIILGKTVTTEFAFMAPGRTRNPHDLSCTPGGSSSGSAAAVASGMVPVALATQTGGSTIRPAAFCGVIGYKPAFGRYPTTGLKHLSPSLDTIGLHARDLDILARVSAVLAGATPVHEPIIAARPRIVLARTHHDGEAEEQAIRRVEQAAEAARNAGAEVRELMLPALFTEIEPLSRLIMSYEAAQSLAHEWAHARDKLSSDLVSFIAHGLAHTENERAAASEQVTAGQALMDTLLADDELLLMAPAAGEAPLGLASTGNAAFNRLWTMLGVPCITLPAGRGVRGLPLGVQLVARNRLGGEQALLARARWVQKTLASVGLGA